MSTVCLLRSRSMLLFIGAYLLFRLGEIRPVVAETPSNRLTTRLLAVCAATRRSAAQPYTSEPPPPLAINRQQVAARYQIEAHAGARWAASPVSAEENRLTA